MQKGLETLQSHQQVLNDVENAVFDALIELGKMYKLTSIEWAAVLTQCLFRELASALADQWEGRKPR